MSRSGGVSRRYGLIDAARGAAIINMIAYHICYDIFCVFGVWQGFYDCVPAVIWERFICSFFIVISGASLHFTKKGYLRGVIVLLCGAAVSAATCIFTPDQMIWFGVLSFIGCAMLLTYACRGLLDRVKPVYGTAAFFALFAFCYGIPEGYIGIFSLPLIRLPEGIYEAGWLAFLGFPSQSFSSADYFPLLPWLFLFVTGYMLWRFIKEKKAERYFYPDAPFLSFIGRHSLVIYMIHQPIIYGILYIVFKVL